MYSVPQNPPVLKGRLERLADMGLEPRLEVDNGRE